MTDNIVPLHDIEKLIYEMKGPELGGHAVIVDGRAIPRLTMRDKGGEIDLILDGRLAFPFAREWAVQAAYLAANAMALGAGYPCATADEKTKSFAPRVAFVEIGGHDD